MPLFEMLSLEMFLIFCAVNVTVTTVPIGLLGALEVPSVNVTDVELCVLQCVYLFLVP